MLQSIDVNTQALGALARATEATASNVANASTPGYAPLGVSIESDRGTIVAVVDRSVSFGQSPAPIPDRPAGDDWSARQDRIYAYQGGNVDMTREAVNLVRYETAFSANAAVIRTVEQTSGTLVNMWA